MIVKFLIISIAFALFQFAAPAQKPLTKEEKKAIAAKRIEEKEAQEAAAKKRKEEVKLKACGKENVDFEADTDKTQHPAPTAPPDKALVYVLRTNWLGFKIHSKLAVDGKWVGVNRGKTYFFLTLDPGERFFCSESENQDAIAVTLEAGKTYYLKQGVEGGVWKARTSLSTLPESKALEELPKLNLSIFKIKEKK